MTVYEACDNPYNHAVNILLNTASVSINIRSIWISGPHVSTDLSSLKAIENQCMFSLCFYQCFSLTSLMPNPNLDLSFSDTLLFSDAFN